VNLYAWLEALVHLVLGNLLAKKRFAALGQNIHGPLVQGAQRLDRRAARHRIEDQIHPRCIGILESTWLEWDRQPFFGLPMDRLASSVIGICFAPLPVVNVSPTLRLSSGISEYAVMFVLGSGLSRARINAHDATTGPRNDFLRTLSPSTRKEGKPQ